VLASRSEEALSKETERCKEIGITAVTYVVCDVSKKESCKMLIQNTVQNFQRIDLLVLNAGVSLHSRFDRLSESDLDLCNKLMAVNYFGCVYCTFFALPYLTQSKGQIGVICSVSGELGLPFRSAYCASKFAVRGFFEALRTEIPSDTLAITIVSPASVNTEMRKHSLRTINDIEFNEPDSCKMSVETCAQLIVKAFDSRKRNVILTTSAKLAVIMKPFLPEVVDYFSVKKSGGRMLSSDNIEYRNEFRGKL